MDAIVAWIVSLTLRDYVTAVPGLIGFGLSVFTLWAAQFRRGNLQMTHPTLICFKFDWPRRRPKIFLRSLLFSTASRGRVIEAMLLKVHGPVGVMTFDYWGHTEAGKLTLGSGLFVGQTGVASDHHFNPHMGVQQFEFWQGEYKIDVFAKIVGMEERRKLASLSVVLSGDAAAEINQFEEAAIYFWWDGEALKYDPQIERGGEPGTWPRQKTRTVKIQE